MYLDPKGSHETNPFEQGEEKSSVVFIDCFSGSVYDLKPRQRGNIRTVLRVLSADPNVSTWDMDNGTRYPLWKTIKKLEDLGYVKNGESIKCI